MCMTYIKAFSFSWKCNGRQNYLQKLSKKPNALKQKLGDLRKILNLLVKLTKKSNKTAH